MLKIQINGKPEETSAKTVEDLLTQKSIEPRMVSVELNGQIVEAEAYGRTSISDGDKFEFLFFMGGGR